MAQPLNPALKAVSDAVLAVASQQSVEQVLQQLVECARELAGARYAALGIPDGAGGFSQFLTTGMSDELIASMGPLPRTHGVLGAMLEETRPFRTEDLHQDPRFRGWWPKGHPDMRSFLGVPIVSPDGVIGSFYLTHKEGADRFSDADQELIELRVDDSVSAGGDGRDQEVFRIAQEALQNALRHAGASHVELRLGRADGRLALEVRDNGVGFRPDDPELRSRRLGLTSMEERAGRIGGRLEIHSAPGQGTDIKLEVAADGA